MKLLLAGMESGKNMDLGKRLGVKDILVSALHMRKKGGIYIDRVMTDFEFVFVDSGAFTLKSQWAVKVEEFFKSRYGIDWSRAMNHPAKMRDFNASPERAKMWDDFLLDVAQWEDDYMKMLAADKRFMEAEHVQVVELDVGNWEMKEARRRRFEAAGFRLVPVLEPADPPAYIDRVVTEYSYVGFGGIAMSRGKLSARHFSSALLRCRKSMTRTHGFGMTRQEPMRRMPFYSVDSTSWLSGARYGITYVFRNGQLKQFLKDVRKKLRRQVEAAGLDFVKFATDDQDTVNAWNMLQWKLYSDWLTNSNFKKGQEYWRAPGGGEYKKVFSGGKVVIMSPEEEPVSEVLPASAVEVAAEAVVEEGAPADVSTHAVPATLPAGAVVPVDPAVLERLEAGQFMKCADCNISDRCPLYDETLQCRLPFIRVSEVSDFSNVIRYLFTLQQKRVTIAALQESADGGILDERLSSEMDRMMRMMSELKEMMNPTETIRIEAKGKGVISKLFGSLKDL